MPITLPLTEMTVDEKLEAMELLWEDLSKNPGDIPSPDWHGNILKERQQGIENGTEKFLDWEDVKKELLDNKR